MKCAAGGGEGAAFARMPKGALIYRCIVSRRLCRFRRQMRRPYRSIDPWLCYFGKIQGSDGGGAIGEPFDAPPILEVDSCFGDL